MQTDSALLEVTALHAGYGRAEVLHGINLRADRGQVITVIGPNGAGKSTLLNALMGVLPSTGGIAYRGRSLHGVALEERVMQGMALVPETRALFGTMTVEDNLELGAYRRARAGQGTRTLNPLFTRQVRYQLRHASTPTPPQRTGQPRSLRPTPATARTASAGVAALRPLAAHRGVPP